MPKRDSDRPCTGCTRDVGSAKSLSEMTDEEWWTYCAPAIMSGLNGTNDYLVSGACPVVENRFTFPLFFYCDEMREDDSKAASRIPDGLWTQRVLDFDEL